MPSDHVDLATLERVDGPGERGWSFDRRGFLALAGAGAAAAAGASAATAAAHPKAGPYDHAGVKPPTPTSPVEYSVTELAYLYERRRLSPVEVVQAYIDRIERYDPTHYKAFNAFVPELALAQAKALQRIPSHKRTPLWGVPFAPKDNYFAKGIPTTANSHIYADFVPEYDSTFVARMKAAGAIYLGQLAMGPLASGRPTTPAGVITTRNAWSPDDDRTTPSGSSGGSGCAPIARLTAFSLGSSTSGSLISPTLSNGATGLKPTYGRTSVYGMIPATFTRDHVGPLGRSARDIAFALQYGAGADANDPRTLGPPRPADYVKAATPVLGRRGPVLRYRTKIGVPAGWASGSTPTALARQQALATLEGLGATLVEFPMPANVVDYSARAFEAMFRIEGSEIFRAALLKDLRLFGPLAAGYAAGLMRGSEGFILGRRLCRLLSLALLDDVFGKVDAVVDPSTQIFDNGGFPQIGFPIGFQTNEFGVRVPIGMSIGATMFDEARLLSVVAAFQADTAFHLERPPEPTA